MKDICAIQVTYMQAMHIANPLPSALSDEVVETLARSKTTRIERIVSHGQYSPPAFWYEQTENEWVYLVQGKAVLQFEANDELVHLSEGMYLNIPAHVRHRVEWTSNDMPTVWLAVFY